MESMPDVDMLVVGGSGFVGSKLIERAVQSGLNVAYTYFHHPLQLLAPAISVDIRDGTALASCAAEILPKAVIYCAKPGHEADQDEHLAVSERGISQLLRALEPNVCRLIYVSTNAVFSGRRGAYREIDLPDADARMDGYRAYGAARARGERLVLEAWPNAIVARTADVNGRNTKRRLNDRLLDLVQQLRTGERLERFSGCYISPTLVDDLIDGLIKVSDPLFNYKGVLHLCGPERMSYYDFTRLVAEEIGVDRNIVIPDLSRQFDTSLDATYTHSLLKLNFSGVRDQLSRIFHDI